MTRTNNLNKLAIAIALLSGAQTASAITPWQANDANASNYGVPDYVIYASGGAAQDEAIVDVVSTTLAQSGTLDVFKDATTVSQSASSWG